MKTQAGLGHFQLNVEYLMFNIVGKTEIGLASEGEGPVIGLVWLKWFIATTFFSKICSSSEEGGHLTSKSYSTSN